MPQNHNKTTRIVFKCYLVSIGIHCTDLKQGTVDQKSSIAISLVPLIIPRGWKSSLKQIWFKAVGVLQLCQGPWRVGLRQRGMPPKCKIKFRWSVTNVLTSIWNKFFVEQYSGATEWSKQCIWLMYSCKALCSNRIQPVTRNLLCIFSLNTKKSL